MRKVLIADDEKTIRNGISFLVSRTGRYEVVAACANGREALERTEELEPDIVITDIRMPEMDGLTYISECSTMSRIPKFIILSGFQEFEYLREAHLMDVVDYILKPVNHSELIELLDRVSDRISLEDGDRQLQFSQYGVLSIQQHEKSRVQIDILKEKLGIELSDIRVTVISLKNGFTMENTLLIKAVDLVKEIFRQGDIHPDITFLYENQIVSIFSRCGNDVTPLVTRLERIVDELEQSLSVSAVAGFGKKVSGDDEIKLSYDQALGAVIGNVYREGRILVYRTEWIANGRNEGYYSSEISKLALALKSRTPRLGDEAIEGFFEKVEKDRPAPGLILEFCENLYQLLRKRFQNYPVDFSFDDLGEDSIRRFILENHPSLEDIKLRLGEVLSGGFEFLKTIGNGKNTHVTDPILEYVDNHLTNEIYLDGICDKFMVNKSYLCSIFKERTGKTFNNYLTEKRIERAKMLLTHENLRINEIAYLVGYKNPRYFTRTFQKLVRMTPSEYRSSAR